MSVPNPLGFLKNRRGDEKATLIRDLITSDNNNETKTRIPHVFAMTVLDAHGAWSSSTGTISYEFKGETKTLPLSEEGMARYIGMRYRINAISKEGLSREEYAYATSSYLAQQQAMGQNMAQMRIDEGTKKMK